MSWFCALQALLTSEPHAGAGCFLNEQGIDCFVVVWWPEEHLGQISSAVFFFFFFLFGRWSSLPDLRIHLQATKTAVRSSIAPPKSALKKVRIDGSRCLCGQRVGTAGSRPEPRLVMFFFFHFVAVASGRAPDAAYAQRNQRSPCRPREQRPPPSGPGRRRGRRR